MPQTKFALGDSFPTPSFSQVSQLLDAEHWRIIMNNTVAIGTYWAEISDRVYLSTPSFRDFDDVMHMNKACAFGAVFSFEI